jgi:hypothetical protein
MYFINKISSLFFQTSVRESVAALAMLVCSGHVAAAESNVKILAPVDQREAWCQLGEGAKCGIVNGEGMMVIGFDYEDVGAFSLDGLLNVRKGKKWGVVDRQNRVVVDFKFDDIAPFAKSGLAAALRGEKWGYINAKGQWAIEPKFDTAYVFSEFDVALVKIGDKFGVIDARGKFLAKPIYDDMGRFEPGAALAFARRDGKVGYINVKGQEQIAFTWDDAYAFSVGGLAVVQRKKKDDELTYGIIDTQGKLIIPTNYEGAYVCDESEWVMLKEKELWGYMSKDGKWQIKPEYDESNCFRTEKQLAPVSKKGKWGFINAKNQYVIPARYDDVRGFSWQGFAPVQRRDKWGFIDATGKVVVPIKHDSASEGTEPSNFLSVDDYFVNSKGQVISDAIRCGVHVTMLDGVVTWPKDYARDNAACKESAADSKKKSSLKVPGITKKR